MEQWGLQGSASGGWGCLIILYDTYMLTRAARMRL